jgi:hypothetical protein
VVEVRAWQPQHRTIPPLPILLLRLSPLRAAVAVATAAVAVDATIVIGPYWRAVHAMA